LREKGLRRVCLVAVRYFGGTKLGLGRLKRVYLGVGEAAVAKASLLEIVPACRLRWKAPTIPT
jgi:putative IMPACT (imprinted ancient) family translation regulator